MSVFVHKYLALISLPILLAACGFVSTPIQPTKLTATPVTLFSTRTLSNPLPTLRPASNFVEGINETPSGKYLFVEYWITWDGSGNCPNAAMIDFPGYNYSSAKLQAYLGITANELATNTIGFLGDGDSNYGAMGGGISSDLRAIQVLPYLIPNEFGTIYSIYREGEIVAEIWDQVYWLDPGQSWVKQIEDNPSSECHTVTTYRFTNYGLLDEDQIQLP